VNAPLRDQRFVSTQDGSTWERKGYDREGTHGLYALAGSAEDSPRLWSVRELAELGLRGMTDVLPVPMGRELTQVERLRARLAEVEGQRAALAERLRAGQTWRQGRLVSEDTVSQPELREIFAIPLAAPLDGITRQFAPVQALREGACTACGSVPDEWCPDCAACRKGCHGGRDNNRCAHPNAPWVGQRAGVEDPHDGPLAHRYLVPRDLPPLDGPR
jgi:hypothetical protein